MIGRERLWKVSGTGYFFSDFYVVADTASMARARASDILHAEHRAKSTNNCGRTSAMEQIVSIKAEPVDKSMIK